MRYYKVFTCTLIILGAVTGCQATPFLTKIQKLLTYVSRDRDKWDHLQLDLPRNGSLNPYYHNQRTSCNLVEFTRRIHGTIYHLLALIELCWLSQTMNRLIDPWSVKKKNPLQVTQKDRMASPTCNDVAVARITSALTWHNIIHRVRLNITMLSLATLQRLWTSLLHSCLNVVKTRPFIRPLTFSN